MHPLAQVFTRPITPALGAWLVGLAVFTVFSVEHLFAAPHAAFVYARLSAYIAAITVAAVTVAVTAVFGLACGVMLWWLDDPVDTRRIAACAGRSFWSLTAYTWIALVLLVADPPTAIDVAELAQPEAAEAQVRDVLAYRWLARMQLAVPAAFLLGMVCLLQRNARLVNAVIAVGFGAGLVAALLTGLGLLGGGEDL